MKKLFILVLVMFMMYAVLSAGTIKVISPNGGENWVIGSTQQIKWNSSGLKNNVKLTLWKNNVFVGLIVKDMPQSGVYSWKVGTYNSGFALVGTIYKINVREQGGKNFQTQDVSNTFFTISDSPDPNPNGIKRINPLPRINTSVMVAKGFQPKKNVLEFKKEVKIEAYGKLTPSSELADFGSVVNIKISFKNATKVKVYNKKTKKSIYVWSRPKPDGNMVTRSVSLNAIETEYEMEVWGPKGTYIANCFMTARPVVNEFRIEHEASNEILHYSISGCEYAYLKKFDENKNKWIRVYKLDGDGTTRKGIYPKKGSAKLVVASHKNTRYALFLIGELKQGVVKSKEIIANFWTDQFTE